VDAPLAVAVASPEEVAVAEAAVVVDADSKN
jgi:hypothetical protein